MIRRIPSAVRVRQKTVTLTNDQIKTLPTIPATIIPATETLNYSITPTRVPVPVTSSLVLRVGGGAYTNVGGVEGVTWLGYGDDLSSRVSFLAEFVGTTLQALPASGFFDDATTPRVGWFSDVAIAAFYGPFLKDNGLYITNFSGGGNFTGGHASNTMTVSVLYHILDVASGRYI